MKRNPGDHTLRYHSFVLTIWQEGEPMTATACWRYSLEYPHTGERIGFRSSADLLAYLGQWTAGPPVADTQDDAAGGASHTHEP